MSAGVYTIQFQSIISSMNFLIESFNFTIARGSVHHLGIALEPAGFRPFYAFKIQVCTCVLTFRVFCLSLFTLFDTSKVSVFLEAVHGVFKMPPFPGRAAAKGL